MDRKPVSSSMIAAVGYDPDSEVLEVEFHGQKVYKYEGVPVGVVEDLIAAPSIGRKFNELVKDFYEAERVE